MTNHVARLYALATSLIVFFAVWLAVSAHPWSQTAKAAPAGDPQIARLIARERQLRAETRKVNLIVQATLRRLSQSAPTAQSRQRRGARAPHRQLAAAHRAAVAAQSESPPRVLQRPAAAPAVRIVTLPPVAVDEDLMTMLQHTFRAMGTDIECLLERPHDAVAEQALDAAEAEFARLEAALSRFLPDSELSRLNAVRARRPSAPTCSSSPRRPSRPAGARAGASTRRSTSARRGGL